MSTGTPLTWDPFEDEQIKLGYETGEKVHRIAFRLHRNYGQIANRAVQLGIHHKHSGRQPRDVVNTHLPMPSTPVPDDVARLCLTFFRRLRMDTLSIAHELGLHESFVVRALHQAREAERAA